MKISKFAALGFVLFTIGCGTVTEPLSVISQNNVSNATEISALSAKVNIKPDLPGVKGERQTVLFSYLPIDDGLDFHIPFYLNTLERTTSAKIYNVAFTDANGPDNTFAWSLNPDKGDKIISPKSAPYPGITEMTTNSPSTLAGAVSWAYSTYPGKFKAFSYLGHGGGYMGISTDNTPGKEGANESNMMTLNQLGRGLKAGLKGRKLNLIHLHACLMANVEAAYELRDLASVLFASQDVVGAHQEGTEKPTEILNNLLQEPNPDARRIGREVVIRVNPNKNPFGYATASAIDLDKIAEVKSAVNVLSQTLIRAFPANRRAITAAYDAVPEFQNYAKSGQRDLWAFSKSLLKINDKNIQTDAAKVLTSLRNVLLHTRDQEGSAANGLSVFMPATAKDDAPGQMAELKKEYLKSRFARETQWDEFIDLVMKN